MSYNLSNLFLESFGIEVNKAYNPEVNNGKADYPSGTYTGIELPEGETGMEFLEDKQGAYKMGYLGTPVLFPITFKGGTYKRFDNSGRIIDVLLEDDFQLPAACIVDFKRPKNIKTTAVSGGYGTVKEIFAFSDWEITINGFFLPDLKQPQGLTTAYKQEIELNRWNELVTAIGVESRIFLDRDIKSITINDVSVQTLRGQPKIRPFTINATSDEPIELDIK